MIEAVMPTDLPPGAAASRQVGGAFTVIARSRNKPSSSSAWGRL